MPIVKVRRNAPDLEAIQFDGSAKSEAECREFCSSIMGPPQDAVRDRGSVTLMVRGRGGSVPCRVGGWIVKDTDGLVDVCDDETFRREYRTVAADQAKAPAPAPKAKTK